MSFELILPFFPAAVQALILDPDVADLCIVEGRKIFAKRHGVMARIPNLEMEPDRAAAAIQQIARTLGQNIDDQHPILDTRLPNGSRIAAIYPPFSPVGVTIIIRKFNQRQPIR